MALPVQYQLDSPPPMPARRALGGRVSARVTNWEPGSMREAPTSRPINARCAATVVGRCVMAVTTKRSRRRGFNGPPWKECHRIVSRRYPVVTRDLTAPLSSQPSGSLLGCPAPLPVHVFRPSLLIAVPFLRLFIGGASDGTDGADRDYEAGPDEGEHPKH